MWGQHGLAVDASAVARGASEHQGRKESSPPAADVHGQTLSEFIGHVWRRKPLRLSPTGAGAQQLTTQHCVILLSVESNFIL